MADEQFIREITRERSVCPSCGGSGQDRHGALCQTCGGVGTLGTTHRFGSLRNNLLAGIVLFVAGVVLVWVFMFLVANG